MAATKASSNGKAKGLPRLVPGGPSKPRARREVDLPGIGASVVIEAPSVGAYKELERQAQGDARDFDVALVALAVVEPEMQPDDLNAFLMDLSVTDYQILDNALADLMGITEEALQSAQREFRGSDN